jgi:hypothetical protein
VLVCLPVFVAAPLVRYSPWLSLAMTLGWLGLSWRLYSRPRTRIWGDLLYGFTLTWLAGSFYWGWLRWEPLWHMPVEALGIPMVWWGARQRFARIGTWFYLGSLWGTAVTDLYIYSVGLLPEWRQAMRFDRLDQATVPFMAALDKMAAPWGGSLGHRLKPSAPWGWPVGHSGIPSLAPLGLCRSSAEYPVGGWALSVGGGLASLSQPPLRC